MHVTRDRARFCIYTEAQARGLTRSLRDERQHRRHGLGAAVAYAARGESLGAGDVLSTGTLPGCCGLEMRRFPKAGDVVRLEVEAIGTLTNTIGRPQ